MASLRVKRLTFRVPWRASKLAGKISFVERRRIQLPCYEDYE